LEIFRSISHRFTKNNFPLLIALTSSINRRAKTIYLLANPAIMKK